MGNNKLFLDLTISKCGFALYSPENQLIKSGHFKFDFKNEIINGKSKKVKINNLLDRAREFKYLIEDYVLNTFYLTTWFHTDIFIESSHTKNKINEFYGMFQMAINKKAEFINVKTWQKYAKEIAIQENVSSKIFSNTKSISKKLTNKENDDEADAILMILGTLQKDHYEFYEKNIQFKLKG